MGRSLLIGLGGSGGKVLRHLYERMTDAEKSEAYCLYIDTDRGATEDMETTGVQSVCISSSDRVQDVASDLGSEDGVFDWLPCEKSENVFLESKTDDGASQCRYKSRLCIARYLKDPNNDIFRMLTKLYAVGNEMEKEMLRVMIVSSIAGGTGTGTFIDVALYIKRVLWENFANAQATIIGLFGCPDLFAHTAKKPDQKETMYATAYAAVRELHAMNMVASDLEQEDPEYGRLINMKIHTKSEGKLFDSKDENFKGVLSSRPFDLIYFVDKVNSSGGVMQDVDNYYLTMSDVAYTRLHSGMEPKIRGLESNFMDQNILHPTAIFGSAGYARIEYPREEILRYLAERRIGDEIGETWRVIDADWIRYRDQRRKAARLSGQRWKADAGERGAHFINSMDSFLKQEQSQFFFLAGDIGLDRNGTQSTRVREYLLKIDELIKSNDGDGKTGDGSFSICGISEVAAARDAMTTCYRGAVIKKTDKAIDKLGTSGKRAAASMSSLVTVLKNNVVGQAMLLADTIMPETMDGMKLVEESGASVNLRFGLLQNDNHDIHPLAARYLLYSLRQRMQKVVEGRHVDYTEALQNVEHTLLMALDNKNDGIDVHIGEYAEVELSKGFGKEARAKAKMKTLRDKIREARNSALLIATNEVKYRAFKMVLPRLDMLIEQYEALFENLDQYAARLRQDADKDLVIHEKTVDNRIYVGASKAMKEYYYSLEVDNGDEGKEHIYRAAGQGIYRALIAYVINNRAKHEQNERLRRIDADVDEYEEHADLYDAFIETVNSYMDHLRESAHHLNQTVISALINQCCKEKNINPGERRSTAANRTIFMNAFLEYMADLKAKAAPMLRYSAKSRQRYFTTEGNDDEKQSITLVGVSAKTAQELQDVFSNNGAAGSHSGLKEAMALEQEPIQDTTVSDYEMNCFSGVYCLQPTQIHMFNEETEQSYFHYYNRRIQSVMKTGRTSRSCHIDKRWHLRGAMPYISMKLENKWRSDLMKALIYKMLMREITFTRDRNGRNCFRVSIDGRAEFVYWPKGNLVSVENISRITEYLTMHEQHVASMANKLDNLVDYEIREISNYSHLLATYKAGMTTNDLLSLMRSDLLAGMDIYSEATAAHGRNAARRSQHSEEAAKSRRDMYTEVFGEDGEDMNADVEEEKTMGGLLEVAWRIHKSEELLGEDRNYGEALLKCAQEIIDRFCRSVYGERIGEDKKTAEYQEYVELYNHAIRKFVMEYVVYTMRKRKLYVGKREKPTGGKSKINGAADIYEGLEIDESIRRSREFAWISQNWKMKDKD